MMEAVVEQTGMDVWGLVSDRFAQVKSLLSRGLGCWHLEMSLPFSRENETYRTCVSCGARRRFDLERWAMVGDFYYPKRQFTYVR